MPDFVSHVCLQYFPFRAFVTMICWTSTEALLNLVAPLDSAVLTLDFEPINTFELPVMIPLVFSGWPAVLEFLELFLNCKWFLRNPWNNEFLRICSWNVLEFYFSSFIKNSAHLFHDSSFWNWCLYIGSSYYFMMLRLL